MEGFIHFDVCATAQGQTPEIDTILPDVSFQVGACTVLKFGWLCS